MNKSTLITTGLLASLAVNIFGAGLMAGHHAGPMHPLGGPPMEPQQGMLAHMERALDPEDAKTFDEQMHRNLPPPDETAMEADSKAVKDALTAREFSPVAFKEALQRLHDKHTAMDKNFVQALTTAVTSISAEGRQQLAKALPDHPPHGPHALPPEGRDDRMGPPPEEGR